MLRKLIDAMGMTVCVVGAFIIMTLTSITQVANSKSWVSEVLFINGDPSIVALYVAAGVWVVARWLLGV